MLVSESSEAYPHIGNLLKVYRDIFVERVLLGARAEFLMSASSFSFYSVRIALI